MTTAATGTGGGRRAKRRGEEPMVPTAEFRSYYGRPIVKAAPWTADVPAYLFTGGLAGGSAVLAAGADLTDRPALRRAGRLGAISGLLVSLGLLIHDLGRPSRFLNMLRVAKPTSPMSVGTWLLTAFGAPASVAALAEFGDRMPPGMRRTLAVADRPAGAAAAAIAPAVMSYTAVLLSDTATPSWHSGYKQLPYVFVGSAAVAAGGFGMLTAPTDEAGPARAFAIGGAALELSALHRMESAMGITAEPLHAGKAGTFMKASKALSAIGVLGALVGRRDRRIAAASGVSLLAASWCTRFGIFHAGQQSAADPKYTVLPQRERISSGAAEPLRSVSEPAE